MAILVEVVDGGVGVAVGVVEGAGEVDEATSMDHSKHLKFDSYKNEMKNENEKPKKFMEIQIFQARWSWRWIYGTKSVQSVCHAPSSTSKLYRVKFKWLNHRLENLEWIFYIFFLLDSDIVLISPPNYRVEVDLVEDRQEDPLLPRPLGTARLRPLLPLGTTSNRQWELHPLCLRTLEVCPCN